jgi:predicted ABC-type ATPase
MDKPEFIMVVGCNAAGKSTFIRTRLNEFEGFEILMTDVYKGRTKSLVKQATSKQRNIVLETVFNDSSFSELADQAKAAGYQTSLVVLFLDNLQESITRVGFRSVQQSGITISGSNVKINFNESFKNVATYFFYFDRSDFIYTGVGNENKLIMSFNKSQLINYRANDLVYPQKFAAYSFQNGRLNEEAHNIIVANNDL